MCMQFVSFSCYGCFPFCRWQPWQHYVCSMNLSSGQIWALLSRLSNHFWSQLLLLLQRPKPKKSVSRVGISATCTVWFHLHVDFCGQFYIYIFLIFNIWDLVCRFGLSSLGALIFCLFLAGISGCWFFFSSHKLTLKRPWVLCRDCCLLSNDPFVIINKCCS